MNPVLIALDTALLIARPLVFAAGVVTAIAAGLGWAVRTKRVSAFSPLARFSRNRLDPMFKPAEVRLLQAGGLPTHAPWWTLAAVVIGGLLLLSALGFVRNQVAILSYAAGAGPVAILRVAVMWAFSVVKLAIIARVIASWVGGGPYSKWWRWAFVISDPIVLPLRRVIPTLGPIDVSPLVAYLGVSLVQGLVRGAF